MAAVVNRIVAFVPYNGISLMNLVSIYFSTVLFSSSISYPFELEGRKG